MCTIGAVIFGPDDYLIFKNKDFARTTYDDRLLVDRDLFGAFGLESFEATLETRERISGLSVGANTAGLLVCDAHVSFEPEGGRNYDRLVEQALREGRDLSTALAAIEGSLSAAPHWAGNLILCDGREVAAVEVRGQELRTSRSGDRIVRTNHQTLFQRNAPASPSSLGRRSSAEERFAAAGSPDEIMEMLASHDQGRSGICNHRDHLRTIYSYLLHCRGGETRLSIVQGSPCCAKSYQHLSVPLGAGWSTETAAAFVGAYPTRHQARAPAAALSA